VNSPWRRLKAWLAGNKVPAGVTITVIGAIVLAVLSWTFGRVTSILAGRYPQEISSAALRARIPADARVTRLRYANLDGRRGPEAIVTTALQRHNGLSAANVYVLAYDVVARRWTTVFDAQRSDTRDPEPGLFDPNTEPLDLVVTDFKNGITRGRDLVVSASVTGGSTPV
jgi:hypothetical protein